MLYIKSVQPLKIQDKGMLHILIQFTQQYETHQCSIKCYKLLIYDAYKHCIQLHT